MPGHDEMRAVRDQQSVDTDPPRLHLCHLLQQDPRIEDDAVANDTGGVGVKNP